MPPNPETNLPESSEKLIEKFKEILKNNGVTDPVSDVIMNSGGLQGENMCSETQCVTVKFENPNVKPLNLFVKLQTASPTHRKFLEDTRMFEKEATFLMKYIPAAREFCRKKGHEELLNIYPKCYYGDEKMVVFEHLVVDSGYVLLDKQEQQDYECARFALTTLAKHHAISYAFMKENGGPKEFFSRFPNLDFEPYHQEIVKEMMAGMTENSIKTDIQMLEKSSIEGKEETISLLKAHQGKIFSATLESLEKDATDECFRVLNHGDYWNNNMMFLKDKETNAVIGHKAVDFQLTRYGTPSIDLAYYFYTSVKGPIRRERFEELMRLYLEILKSTTSDLDHPLEINYEEFVADYRKKIKFGFWIGMTMFAGGGYAIVKDLDPNKLEMGEWATLFNKLIEEWIEKNPEKSLETAQTIHEYVSEYRQWTGC